MNIYAFLHERNIPFQRFDHPAVMTCEEAEKLAPMPGAATKNLFLKDEKGRRHFLVVVPHEKRVDLRSLESVLDVRRIGFASPERMRRYLDLEPGSVTMLGLVHDVNHAVELVIDEGLWRADAFQCHPLVNTATLVLSKEGLKKFLDTTGHQARICPIPVS